MRSAVALITIPMALSHCGSSNDEPAKDAGTDALVGDPGRDAATDGRAPADAGFDARPDGDAGLDASPDAGPLTVRVSEPPSRVDADRETGDLPGISGDGRFVSFYSAATNLVAGDTNGKADPFVYDRTTRAVTRILGLGDAEPNGNASVALLSADGRFVAFASSASNLVAGDLNGKADVFLFDRTTNATVRASPAQANADSHPLSISGDGGRVVFFSSATNLVGGDTNGGPDVFVFDRTTSSTGLVSAAMNGAPASGVSIDAAISGNGLFVAFGSAGSNIVANDTNGVTDVFVRDLAAETTTRVSVSSTGEQGNGASNVPFLSADARYVAYLSTATNLVADDTNGFSDIFVHDRATSKTKRINLGMGGTQANGPSENPKLSADGRFVVYRSNASNLVPGDLNGVADVFLYDTVSGTTTRVSVDTRGAESNGAVSFAAFAAGGHAVAFASAATNLVAGDGNGVSDVFLRLLP